MHDFLEYNYINNLERVRKFSAINRRKKLLEEFLWDLKIE